MKFKSFILGTLLLASCSHDGILYQEEDGNLSQNQGKTMFYVPPFELQNGGQTTRTDLEINQDVASFKWVAGDEVGIFAFDAEGNRKGDQVYFSVTPNPTDPRAANAVFDGGGWQVKKGMNYCAYYPFIPMFRLNPQDMRVDFTGQKMLTNNDYSHIGEYDFMVSMPKGQASIDGGMSFEFKHLGALCIAKIHTSEDGTLKSLKFEFEDGSTPFAQTAQFDASKGNLATLTPLSSAASFTVEMDNINVKENTPIEIPFMMCPAQVKDKTCKVILTYDNNNGQQIMRANEFKFQANIEGGKGYGYNLSFPKIDPSTHVIINPIAGSLCMGHVTEAMGEGNKVTVKGELNGKDIAILRKAAGYVEPGTQSASKTRTTTSTLQILDLSEVKIVEGEGTIANTISGNFFSNTQLSNLTLPTSVTKIETNAFENTPIDELKFKALDPNTVIAEGAFTNFNNAWNCFLTVHANLLKYIKNCYAGLSFCGIEFSRGIMVIDDDDQTVAFAKADASTNTIETCLGGFITEEMITEAMAGTDALTVVGPINVVDFKALRTAAGGAARKGEQESSNPNAKLQRLNLEDAVIVRGQMNGSTYDNHLLIPEAFRASQLISISLPKSATIFGADRCFENCKKLTDVKLPYLTNENTAEFGGDWLANGMFNGCTLLKSIEIPATITEIQYPSFENSGLETLVVPATVRVLQDALFKNCAHLTSLKLLCAGAELWKNVFRDFTNAINCDLYIPANKVADWVQVSIDQTNVVFKIGNGPGTQFKSIRDIQSGTNIQDLIDEEVL